MAAVQRQFHLSALRSRPGNPRLCHRDGADRVVLPLPLRVAISPSMTMPMIIAIRLFCSAPQLDFGDGIGVQFDNAFGKRLRCRVEKYRVRRGAFELFGRKD